MQYAGWVQQIRLAAGLITAIISSKYFKISAITTVRWHDIICEFARCQSHQSTYTPGGCCLYTFLMEGNANSHSATNENGDVLFSHPGSKTRPNPGEGPCSTEHVSLCGTGNFGVASWGSLGTLHRVAPLGLCSKWTWNRDWSEKEELMPFHLTCRTVTQSVFVFPYRADLSLLEHKNDLKEYSWMYILPKNQANVPPWCYLTRKTESLKERRYFKT